MWNAVLVFQGGGEELFFRRAAKRLAGQYGEGVSFHLFDSAKVDTDPQEYENCRSALEKAGFVYLSLHGGVPFFKSFHALQKSFWGKTPVFVHSGIEDENDEFRKNSRIASPLYAKLLEYQLAGGEENCENFLLCVMAEIGGMDCAPAAVRRPVWDGLYGMSPGYDEEKTLDEAAKTEKPVVGILVHYHYMLHQNTRHIDALMEAVRRKGGYPLAVYTNMMPTEGYGGLNAVMDKYLLRNGQPIIDVLIVTVGHSLTALSAPGIGQAAFNQSVFARLDIPVLQAMTTFFTLEQWQASLAGLDSMLLCSTVFQPEFDGQIITVPIGCTEAEQTSDGVRYVIFPIPDRVEKVAGIAMGWVRLRRTPMQNRRVAIILHNMPPRADMIGCAYGLDTPQSVYNMVQALKREGLSLDYDYADGGEIIEKITAGLTNDCRFLSPAEMLERCEATVKKEAYPPWLASMPEKVRGELLRDWGDPPGEFMAQDGEVLIPGIHNGNLFIGLQPPRAFEEKAEEAYHSTDLVCPYQYLFFYRYLKEVFGAHVVVHVGTHGTLEWLPGKEIGLSRECYPDVALGDVPHLYPYIIDVPGEGAQAKRRSDAVIIDHLIPSMTDSGLYGALSAIDDSIAAYHHAQLVNPEKLPSLSVQIWRQAQEQNLHTDLGLTESAFQANPEEGIGRLHVWLSGIKGAKIKNGLHLFGQPPRGERYDDMLRLLVNIRNGEVPSLREGLCALYGEDLNALLEAPETRSADGKTNAVILERIDEAGRRLFAILAESGYACGAIDSAIARLEGELPAGKRSAGAAALKACLAYVCQSIVPKLNATTDELDYFLRGINGRFVPQGPSGAPSRGNADILPTGRNFFMIDPTAVPSRAAWETGKRLGDALLQKHLREEGHIPEGVAIVVYSGETIKTSGDDIAEIMYLYGVRPVWLEHTDRVIGLEVIPLNELGRPRIDVTLRISGLFRDTFPNLIERIEDAVNLVAALEEDEEDNFVKKHIRQDVRCFLDDGMSKEQAFEYAKLRVFGCPPGTYGAGVDILVNSKKWERTEDLGQAYITWGGHAYGKNIHGAKLPRVFARRLQTTGVTVKNISSYESDMLDSDDFYNYHGGLISAVKAQKGSFPVSYSTNAGDPAHVETRTVHEETSRIMRARIANPKWAQGLHEHGYKGAQEISAMVDIVFGWDATSDVVDGWMYDTIAQNYVLSDDMRAWIQEVNPWALHAMSERLLEAAKRGMWDADDTMLKTLSDIFLSTEGELEGA